MRKTKTSNASLSLNSKRNSSQAKNSSRKNGTASDRIDDKKTRETSEARDCRNSLDDNKSNQSEEYGNEYGPKEKATKRKKRRI